MTNNHYIPEFLTSPWLKSGSPLWHFDFTKQEFSEKPSNGRLFAKKGLWSEALEVYLNRHTENFSALARKKIITQGIQPDQKEFRSLYLLILFQAARSGYMKDLGNDLEEITTFDEIKLDQLIHESRKKWILCGLSLPAKSRLFFPDTGIFAFPFLTSYEFKWIFALPLEGTFCLALVPVGVDTADLDTKFDFSTLTTWSICSSAFCEKVVIHPDLYHYKDKRDELKSILNRMRQVVDEQIPAINQINHLQNIAKQLTTKIFR